MDSLVIYNLGVDIPFNAETSKGWTGNAEMAESFINVCVAKIMRVIEVQEYISLTRILRIFGMREQAEQPCIFFEKLDDAETHYNRDDGSWVVTLYLSGGYLQNPARTGKKPFKPYIVKDAEENEELGVRSEEILHDALNDGKSGEVLKAPKVTEINKDGKAVAGRYQWGTNEESGVRSEELKILRDAQNDAEKGGEAECRTGLREISGSAENETT